MQDMIEKMLPAESIALDMEADSLHHYYEKVCLIQLTIGTSNFIVDPLCGINLTAFLNMLASKPLILHDAGYDLRMLRNSFGFVTECSVFDTMLAAQLLGYERLGLVALIERFFDISLPKQDQKSNWSKRPLTKDQLQYASDDTFYLHEIAALLESELKRLGRFHWHQQACEKMIYSAALEKLPADPDNIWRIKGSSRLQPLQLTLLRAIWHWRDKQARAADLPPFKVMGNQFILKLTQLFAADSRTSLTSVRGLPRTCAGKRLKLLENPLYTQIHVCDSAVVLSDDVIFVSNSFGHPACQKVAERLEAQYRFHRPVRRIQWVTVVEHPVEWRRRQVRRMRVHMPEQREKRFITRGEPVELGYKNVI